MNYFAVVTPQGECLQITSMDGLPKGPPMGNSRYIQVEQGFVAGDFYFEDDCPVLYPDKPDNFSWDWKTKTWVDLRTAATEWVLVRSKRTKLLEACDYTQLSDSNKDKQAWAAYRQALRDITEQSDPFKVQWPTKPS